MWNSLRLTGDIDNNVDLFDYIHVDDNLLTGIFYVLL